MSIRRKIALWICPELGEKPTPVSPLDLVDLARAYAGHFALSVSRVSFLVRGDGGFFQRLTKGAGCTVKTSALVVQWFSDSWPADLEWPAHIQRPKPTDKKDAA